MFATHRLKNCWEGYELLQPHSWYEGNWKCVPLLLPPPDIFLWAFKRSSALLHLAAPHICEQWWLFISTALHPSRALSAPAPLGLPVSEAGGLSMGRRIKSVGFPCPPTEASPISFLHCNYLHFSHNYCLFSSQAHPPLHLPVRNSIFPKLISTPFLSLLLTNHILFLLSWVLFLCWEELRFWLYVRNTNHHRSICRHINLPESQVGSGTHTYISLPKT